MEEIYLRLYKTSKVQGRDKILIRDIANISGPEVLKIQVEELSIIEPKEPRSKHYAIGIIEVIDTIRNAFPDLSIQSVGEMDGVVDFNPQNPKRSKVWERIKLAGVCVVVFSGTVTAIMTYQTDSSMAEMFKTMYQVFTGEVTDNPVWLTIPYSIGMPIGIIAFFNHLGTKKFTDDPTPIEIEINSYERQVDDTIIDTETIEKRGQMEKGGRGQ